MLAGLNAGAACVEFAAGLEEFLAQLDCIELVRTYLLILHALTHWGEVRYIIKPMGLFKPKVIADIMRKDVIFVRVKESISSAYEKMKAHKIWHLPVIDDEDHVVGVFTETHLLQAYHPRETQEGWSYDKDSMARLSLEHFMSPDPTTLMPDDTLKLAAELIARYKYGCVSVVSRESKKLIGIITYTDLLREFANTL